MIILINGSFGIGKTTVGKLLRNSLPHSIIYNPEWVGSILMRLPKFIKLKGVGTDGFQDIELWRRLFVIPPRLYRYFTSGPIIIPMTFTRKSYFGQIVHGLISLDSDLRIFCLKANLLTIQSRLAGRNSIIEGRDPNWASSRIKMCIEVHQDPYFGEPIETDECAAYDVAMKILEHL